MNSEINTVTVANIEIKLLELVKNKNARNEFELDLNYIGLDKLRKSNEIYKKCCDDFNNLSYSIYSYFKEKIINIYNKNGKNDTVQFFYKTKESLQRNDKYEEATGVIMFDLTYFTSNLIKKL